MPVTTLNRGAQKEAARALPSNLNLPPSSPSPPSYSLSRVRNMSPVASAFSLLPKDYAWTALVASSTCPYCLPSHGLSTRFLPAHIPVLFAVYLHLYQILKVSSLRKASGIKYPQRASVFLSRRSIEELELASASPVDQPVDALLQTDNPPVDLLPFYLAVYAEVTEVEKSPVAKQFNCAQRGASLPFFPRISLSPSPSPFPRPQSLPPTLPCSPSPPLDSHSRSPLPLSPA